ncbi:flagellar hook protein FlgE [Rhizosaccharibacter radicis]|uniref:Flagellar hook protein FlgE n=1 Tax=Rhizosaccharibacter radicis TaxID=2782605 RepID=A0ABT1VSA2_9PROT|nr:flagellar hook protein FlgE [Acetobacteraceae bacterium KSS12]
MSIFGALNTAVSGLSAQAHSFTDISNNISNSQTIGYKATETDFSDYVLTSGASQGTSGTVIATTAWRNQAQGTITSSSNALALAISGNGFFAVNEESGDSTTNNKVFQAQQYYTRNGNFSQNNLGYLVNSSNEYLDGYMVDASGNLNTKTMAPINVSNVTFRPTQSNTITFAGSLPGGSATVTPSAPTSTAQTPTHSVSNVYDATGAAHTLSVDWARGSAPNSWTVSTTLDGAATPAQIATVTFDATTGTMSSITDANGVTNAVAGAQASVSIPAVFDGVSQPIALNLGKLGSPAGTTMGIAASAPGAAASVQSDSITSGNFTGVTMTSNGNVMATFDNNQTQMIAKIPLATFADADSLLAHDGQAYTATAASGQAAMNFVGQNGAGALETSSVENSTTSLDTDLTRLITAQQAYGANAKVVTTANDMLQTVLSMKQ